jgi:hypothetical protein
MALERAVGQFNMPTVTGNVQVTTTLPALPKMLILFGARLGSNNTTGTTLQRSFGAATSAGAQWVVSQAENGTSQAQYADSTHCLLVVSSVGVTSHSLKFVSFDTIGPNFGFTVNCDAAGSTYLVNYVVFGGADITNAQAFTFTSPTAAGLQNVTAPGFAPDVVFLASQGRATGGAAVDATASRFGLGIGTSTLLKGTAGHADSGASAGHVLKTTKVLTVPTDAGGTTLEADLSAILTNGVQLNWNKVQSSACDVFGLAIKGGVWHLTTMTQPASTGNYQLTGLPLLPRWALFLSAQDLAGAALASGSYLSLGAGVSSTQRVNVWGGNSHNGSSSGTAQFQGNARVIDAHSTNPTTQLAQGDLVSFDTLGSGYGLTTTWATTDGVARQTLVLVAGSGTMNLAGLAIGGSASMGLFSSLGFGLQQTQQAAVAITGSTSLTLSLARKLSHFIPWRMRQAGTAIWDKAKTAVDNWTTQL